MIAVTMRFGGAGALGAVDIEDEASLDSRDGAAQLVTASVRTTTRTMSRLATLI
jgi:hypothetical protein